MDDEYQQLRAKRLQELQQEGTSQNKMQDAARQQQEREEMRNTMLSQILSQEARARLNTLKTAKPEKAKMAEDILINQARMGAINSRLSEDDLKRVLECVSQQFRETKVNYDRRRSALDSDED